MSAAGEGEWKRMRTRWLAPLIALLMGCLVGGYSIGTSLSTMAGVVVSALALALPAALSVLIDPAISRRGLVVAGVAATALLLGGLLIGGAAFPAVWQGYSSDAAGISVLAELLLTPFVAAFVVSPLGTRPEDNAWDARASVYGLLAWAGVGLQAVALPYLLPFGSLLVTVLVLHQPVRTSSGGFTNGWVFGLIFVFFLVVLYLIGFGYAVLLGLLGGALRKRLARHPRIRGHTSPSEVGTVT